MRFLALIYLGILGIKDCKDREIPMWWLLAGLFLFVGFGIYRSLQGEMVWPDMLVGMLPGIMLLVLARLSGKAGFADGIVLTEMGLYLGYRESVFVFCCSVVLLAVFSVMLLFLKKVHRNTRMPYLPFLAVVCLLRQW